MQSLTGLAQVGIDHAYGQLCMYQGIQLKSELGTPKLDRSQHARPAYWLLAQEYFLATSFPQGKFRSKNITLFFFFNLRVKLCYLKLRTFRRVSVFCSPIVFL
jgi:hypothetical protein